MSRVRSKDTTPEMIVRRLLHAMGYRYRLHGKNLPGKSDLVFAGRKDIGPLEAILFTAFDATKALMNGSILRHDRDLPDPMPSPTQIVQILTEDGIKVRLDPSLRLPRQVEHIGRLIDQILSVKDSKQLRRSLAAHFERLNAYRHAFLEQGSPIVRKPGQSDESE